MSVGDTAAISVPDHVPDHVPADRVVDIDLYNIPGADEDVHLAWKSIQDRVPDLFFTPRYGGYWVLARAELLNQAWPDFERFSSAGGIAIPRLPDVPRQLPIDVDPPEHRYFRAPISVALTPKALQSLVPRARALAIELIENLQPKGRCEFVAEFGSQLPIAVFLSMVDLPMTDRGWLLERAEIAVRESDPGRRGLAFQEIFGYLDGWLRKRAEQPGEDLLSRILDIKVGERPITHQEALSESALVLFGGLDTVAGTMAFSARYLASHPDQRRQLVDDPSLIPQAVDELIRRHSIPTVARQLTADVTLDGVTMKQGDYVMLITYLHSLDERQWADPLKVDFHRPVHDLMSFGRGVHKCPGANLARSELRIFLEEWLKRIPDFEIAAGESSPTAAGAVMGVRSLPLVWKTSAPVSGVSSGNGVSYA